MGLLAFWPRLGMPAVLPDRLLLAAFKLGSTGEIADPRALTPELLPPGNTICAVPAALPSVVVPLAPLAALLFPCAAFAAFRLGLTGDTAEPWALTPPV